MASPAAPHPGNTSHVPVDVPVPAALQAGAPGAGGKWLFWGALSAVAAVTLLLCPMDALKSNPVLLQGFYPLSIRPGVDKQEFRASLWLGIAGISLTGRVLGKHREGTWDVPALGAPASAKLWVHRSILLAQDISCGCPRPILPAWAI